MHKNKKYSINTTVVTIGVLVIVVLINLFVSLLVKKVPIRFDMTSDQLYALSDETIEMLKNYDTKVDLYFVAGTNYEKSDRYIANVSEVLKKYALNCPSIEYTNVNSQENPTFGQKYVKDGGVLDALSVIIDAGDRFKVYDFQQFYTVAQNSNGNPVVTSLHAEQIINSGLRYVSGKEDYTAYFITGHNEEEFAGLRARLDADGYIVGDVNLATEEIPEDADIAILAGPKIDYTPAEVAKLDAHLSKQKKMLVTFGYTSGNLTNLYEYLRSWGIEALDEVAVETDQAHTVSQVGLLLADYGTSAITSELQKNNRYIGYYPYSKTLQLLFDDRGGIKTEAVLLTTDKAYSTANYETLENTSQNTGAQVIAATAQASEGATIFVSGNTALMDVDEETVVGHGFANYDYIGSIFSYLQGEDEEYKIQPKYLAGGRLIMNSAKAFIWGGIFAIVIPMLFLIYGVVVWFRRRHL